MNHPRSLPAALAACAILAGCDLQVPTEPPIFEPRWIIPVEGTVLELDELLPASVDSDGTTFGVTVDPVSPSESLGELCAACVPLDGFVAPVPPFVGGFGSETSLPEDVQSVEIATATVEVSITNGFGFDPLEGGGTLTIRFLDAGSDTELGRLALEGPTDTLAPGETSLHTVVLPAGTISEGIRAEAELDAPGGQIAPIDTDALIEVIVDATILRASALTIDVPSLQVELEPQAVDLEDVKEEIAERIMAGALLVDVVNPFGVSLDGQLVIGETVKPLVVGSENASTVEIGYTGEELRSFVGRPGITLSGWGVATGTGITITPGQALSLDATLDFTLRIG